MTDNIESLRVIIEAQELVLKTYEQEIAQLKKENEELRSKAAKILEDKD